jgi:hypothetical protein
MDSTVVCPSSGEPVVQLTFVDEIDSDSLPMNLAVKDEKTTNLAVKTLAATAAASLGRASIICQHNGIKGCLADGMVAAEDNESANGIVAAKDDDPANGITATKSSELANGITAAKSSEPANGITAAKSGEPAIGSVTAKDSKTAMDGMAAKDKVQGNGVTTAKDKVPSKGVTAAKDKVPANGVTAPKDREPANGIVAEKDGKQTNSIRDRTWGMSNDMGSEKGGGGEVKLVARDEKTTVPDGGLMAWAIVAASFMMAFLQV